MPESDYLAIITAMLAEGWDHALYTIDGDRWRAHFGMDPENRAKGERRITGTHVADTPEEAIRCAATNARLARATQNIPLSR